MITGIGFLQIAFYLAAILILVKPLGWYMAWIYKKDSTSNSFERHFYRFCRIEPAQEMNWKTYLSTMLIFNLAGLIFIYLIQRLQIYLPLNPQNFSAPTPQLAFNTAISFITNSNWQAYSGETTMSYFTQMFAFTSQNFLSAATGIALLMAVIRGITSHRSKNLGNFWVDLVRATLYILLPLAFIFALILVSQGVIQNFKPNQKIEPLQPQNIAEQIIPMGPVASQIAIKQLGTNGGGFFAVNSAHPFENPTPLSNFLELLAILLIPAALCYSFGIMINDKRHGWALLAAMFILFIPFVTVAVIAEQRGNPAFAALGIDQHAKYESYLGGNMEGKETRFGIVGSALWAVATTATSNGSVNSMHDSYTPIGGLVPLWMMHLGELVFGGVGSGLYFMLSLVIITVFVAGLMVGRTPEYLGKKIEPYEMKMASLAILIMPLIVLIATAIAAVTTFGTQAITNPGAHGLSQMLYAFTSMGNNNGSAFAGLKADHSFYNLIGGLAMLVNRYWIAIPLLAMAGSLAQKKIIPNNSGTLPTHTPLFIGLLIAVILLIGALSFLPVLALGPIAEELILRGEYGH